MSIYFGWNFNYVIRVKPSKTFGNISPHITNLTSGTGIRFGHNSGDVIPPWNIGNFGLMDRGTYYFPNSIMPWHGAAKIESENPGGDRIFENTERENNFEVEKVGRKNSGILNHVGSILINTISNHIDSNHNNSNQLTRTNSIKINDSVDVCVLNQLLSWDRDSTNAAASTVSTRTP